jgi:hypothetical protein
MDENEDAKLFLKDAGKTVEETVDRVRGFAENYHYLLHRTMLALPWMANVRAADTLRQYAEQDFGAALQFARDLQETNDFQDAARLQTKYAETCFNLFWTQAKDFAQTTMTSPAHYPAG